MASTASSVQKSGGKLDHGPWYFDSTFLKRASVVLSIVLSIASLVLSAVGTLKKENADILKALNVTGIVINSVSIVLSALTSLDWQSMARKNRKFAQQLVTVTHVYEDGRVALSGDQKLA